MTNEMSYILPSATAGVESCGIQAGGVVGWVSKIGALHRPAGAFH